jgi:hypothetical protein
MNWPWGTPSPPTSALVEDYAGGLFVVLRCTLWNNRIEYGETHIFCGPATWPSCATGPATTGS